MELIFNALTAIGTVGACIISLLLASGKYKHKLDCVFIWGTSNDYKPTLLVNNLCSRTIIIHRIDIFFARKCVASFNISQEYSMKDYAIIPANTEKYILFDADKFHFPDSNKNDMNTSQIRKTLRIVVNTSSGDKFVSKQKYSQDEIAELLFGYGLFGSD